MIHTNSQIAQTCNLKSDHNIHDYVQASQVELILHIPISFKWPSLERTNEIVCKHICNATVDLITTMMQ